MFWLSSGFSAQTAIEARMSVFCTIQHDSTRREWRCYWPRHAAAELEMLPERDREAVRDAIIADTLHLFAGANDDDDDGLDVSMSATKLRAAPAALEGPEALVWWANLQEADARKAHRLSPWCRAARMFLSLPAGGAPPESAFSSTSEMVTKKRMRLGDDTLELMTVVRDYV